MKYGPVSSTSMQGTLTETLAEIGDLVHKDLGRYDVAEGPECLHQV